ncbi:hypothetical protein KCU83_g5045, partial [Aureobasidium melanogenum]
MKLFDRTSSSGSLNSGKSFTPSVESDNVKLFSRLTSKRSKKNLESSTDSKQDNKPKVDMETERSSASSESKSTSTTSAVENEKTLQEFLQDTTTGSDSHVIPETPPSSGTEAVFPTVEQENVFEGHRWVAPSRSLQDIMHKKLFTRALAASNKALASTERDGNPSSDPRMKPLKLDFSSTEARSQTSERITSQRRSVRSSIGIGVAPPPRFINPAKIAKSKDEKRGTASYLNQQQLYMLRQQETRVVGKLETKSIPQLQMLQHKALTSHASNRIKNLIQKTLFEKHMAEMKDWESQVDV